MLQSLRMTPQESFYRDGFHVAEFKQDQDYETLMSLLRDVADGKVKDGFQLITKDKFPNALDLRPHPLSAYDPILTGIMERQGIFKMVSEVSCRNLVLAHIRIRINKPAKAGYTGWHRDTSFYNGVTKGNAPPMVNLHFYPNFDEEPETTFLAWPGTHRQQFENRLLDHMIIHFKKPTKIATDNVKFNIVDTSLVHDVAPTTYQKGALRLMYSFCDPSQLGNFADAETKLT